MDAVSMYRSCVRESGIQADVYRPSSGRDYDSGYEDTDKTVTVAISDASNSGTVETEGADDDPSFRGLVVPEYDANGTIVHTVQVNDELRINGRRYAVRTKTGIPNEIDPEVWQLGLDSAASA